MDSRTHSEHSARSVRVSFPVPCVQRKWQVSSGFAASIGRFATRIYRSTHTHRKAQAHTCTAVARLAVLHYCHVDFLRSASVSFSFLPLSLFSLLLLCPLGVCCVCVLYVGCVLSYPCVHACGECCNVLVQTSRTLSSPVAILSLCSCSSGGTELLLFVVVVVVLVVLAFFW